MATRTDLDLLNTANFGGYVGSSYILNGARGVTTASVGSTKYVYVAGYHDDGITILEMSGSGGLTFVGTVGDGTSTALDGASGLTSAEIGGSTYIYAAGEEDDGLSVFRVRPDGTLAFVQSVFDDLELELDGPGVRGMSVAEIGSQRFLIVPSYDDNGLQIFRINSNGTLTSTASIDTTELPEDALDQAMSTAVAQVDGKTFALVTSYVENSVSVFELGQSGTVTYRTSQPDNASLEIYRPTGVTTADVDGKTLVFVAGQVDDGISVFELLGSGDLVNVSNIGDTTEIGLNGVDSLEAFSIEGEVYLSATGYEGLTLFQVSDTGQLLPIEFIADDSTVELRYSRSQEFVTHRGSHFLIASGETDDGISVFSIGGGSSVMEGTNASDDLFGLGGNDVLIGFLGGDLLNGGAGEDTASYVTATSRVIVDLTNQRSGAGEAAGDVFRSVENVLATSFNDRIYGNGAVNTIWGQDGNDYIAGGGKNDFLFGEGGNDILRGDNGNDNLVGAGGSDKVWGGKGSDKVSGGGGADVAKGGAGADRLNGGGGNDRLEGGSGNDFIAGGNGKDSLVGNGGKDKLLGDKGADQYWGGAGADDFVFRKLADSRSANGIDVIRDFGRGDDVDLRQIDADATSGGNQRFDFIGGQRFSGEAGELRFKNGVLQADVDGDRRPDFIVKMAGVDSMSESDFLL